ncbi:MAG: hypothetical protein EOP82_07165 [Variovorax sp.]|nr:MAG: hypothetical protein EOP82_07165 [Variovorax sp.]
MLPSGKRALLPLAMDGPKARVGMWQLSDLASKSMFWLACGFAASARGFTSALAFWLGTTRDSARKTKLLSAPTLQTLTLAERQNGGLRTSLILAAVFAAGLLVGTQLDAVKRMAPRIVSAIFPADRWAMLEYRETDAEVACPADAAVIVTIGQSNAANSVGHRFAAEREVFETHKGRCYKARGALAGAGMPYGSYWPLVGDLLVDGGLAQRPVFVGLAKGNTTVAEWADPAQLGGYLARNLHALKGVQYVLWHQGEADTKTSPAKYAEDLQRVIAIVHTNAPGARILIAQASLCGDGQESAALLRAQASVIDPAAQVFAGPNTDSVRGFEDRYDGCHLSERGARTVAKMWADKIMLAK